MENNNDRNLYRYKLRKIIMTRIFIGIRYENNDNSIRRYENNNGNSISN